MGIFFINLKCGGSLMKEQWREWNLPQEFIVSFDRREDHKALFFRICFGLLD